MISAILNLPYSLLGFLIAILLVPKKVEWHKKPFALIFSVQFLWLLDGLYKGWRGIGMGNVVVLNKRRETGDLEHELIHIEQYGRYPLIFQALYWYELIRHGYRNNKYEDEAYTRAGNAYKGKSS